MGPKEESQAKRDLEVRQEKGGAFVQAVDTTSMAMIVTDCRARGNPIIYANPSFLELTGYSADEIIGQNYTILYGQHTDPEAARKVKEALNATGDIVLELMLYRKDRRGLWVLQHVSVQREDGEVKRHFASFWDIDRRVRAEKEVRRARALLEQRVAMRTREIARTVEDLRRENEKRRAVEETLLHTLADKEGLLRQREALVHEVNHRVKNTLQMVSSLLTVQAGLSPEPGVAEGLASAIRRLDRLAEVHQLLYEAAEIGAGITLSTYISLLCDRLLLASDADTRRITMEVDIEEACWSADEAVPIALIVNEAVTNSLKYAFPEGRTGTISVSLQAIGPSLHELVVADDGVGGPAGPRPGSLGMKLIGTFARQLQGSMSFEGTTGTRIAVRFRHEDLEPPRLAE